MIQKRRRTRRLGRGLSLFASIGFGVITAGAFHMVFPALSYAYALIAGALTVAVEGEIFWKDVPKAMERIFIDGPANQIRQNLVRSYMKEKLSRMLAQQLEKDPSVNCLECAFSHLCDSPESEFSNKAYYQALIEYERLAVKHDLSELEQQRFNTDLPRILSEFELSLFINTMNKDNDIVLDDAEVKALQRLSARYIRLNILILIFAIITGLSFGIFAFMKAGGLLSHFIFGVALTASSPISLLLCTGGFAFLAFAAYGFTMYHALSLLLSLHPNQIRAKWAQFYRTVFLRHSGERVWRYVVRVSISGVLLLGLVGLSLFALFGEGGAYFASISSFFATMIPALSFFPALPTVFAFLAITVLLPVFAVFMFKNIVSAVVSLFKKLKDGISFSLEDKSYANIVHLINPFVWLDRLIEHLLILAHVWFEGAVSASGVSCGAAQITAWSGASLVELLVDLPYVEDEHHDAKLKTLVLKSGEPHTHGFVLVGLRFILRVIVLIPACIFDCVFTLGDFSRSWARVKDTFSLFFHDDHHGGCHGHSHEGEQDFHHHSCCSTYRSMQERMMKEPIQIAVASERQAGERVLDSASDFWRNQLMRNGMETVSLREGDQVPQPSSRIMSAFQA